MKRVVPALVAFVLLAAGCGPAPEPAGEGLSVRDAWVRAAPPGAGMTAAYLVVANPGPEPAFLVGASSPAFAMAEVHETVVVDGVSRMRHRPRVEVPAGGEAALAPGGLHVMLMRPNGEMPAGGSVILVLAFEDGRTVTVDAPVRRPE